MAYESVNIEARVLTDIEHVKALHGAVRALNAPPENHIDLGLIAALARNLRSAGYRIVEVPAQEASTELDAARKRIRELEDQLALV